MDTSSLFRSAYLVLLDKADTVQRLYSELTSPQPPPLRREGTLAPSSTAFAGLPAGPGNAKSFHETNQQMRAGAAAEEVGLGVTTFRVGTRGRIFLDEARWKGVAYRLGAFFSANGAGLT